MPIHEQAEIAKGKQKESWCKLRTNGMPWIIFALKNCLRRIEKKFPTLLREQNSTTGLFKAGVTLSVISPFHC